MLEAEEFRRPAGVLQGGQGLAAGGVPVATVERRPHVGDGPAQPVVKRAQG